MNPVRLALIFTGHGERDSLPILVRRVAGEIDPFLAVKIINRRRIPESKRATGDLDAAVERAARLLGNKGGILIVMDSDWEGACPAKDGPALNARVQGVRPEMPVALVLAHQEYEAWFIAAAVSLREKRCLDPNLQPASDPEGIRDAKGWLSQHMPRTRPYAPVTDQPALTNEFDMAVARRGSPSFDKCYREITKMIRKLKDMPDA